MTPAAMIDQFRRLARDTGLPQRWSDDTLLVYLNEGRSQAIRRARLIEDGDTTEICKLSLKAGKQTYDVDKRVIFIRRMKLATKGLPLPKIAVADLDLSVPGWESAAPGDVRAWAAWGNHKVRFIDPPEADDTARMYVMREALLPMTMSTSEDDVEIDTRLHFRLIDWMRGRAYSERDEEKYRPDEAREAFAMFDQEFGPASNAALESWIHRKHGYDDYEGIY